MTMTSITPRTSLTAEELADLRSRMCGQKRPYAAYHAQEVAARMRAQGEKRVSAYPCPFHSEDAAPDRGRTWHVGHAPSVYRMELLARYLRFGGPCES